MNKMTTNKAHLYIIIYTGFCNILFILAKAQIITDSTIMQKEISDNNVMASYSNPLQGVTSQRFEKSHKPIFENCETYKPKVEEEQKANTFVIQVNATDKDPPDEKGGKVTYKIVQREGERIYFTINNTTGEIATTFAFDRDYPDRLKELHLIVQATDDGRPPLFDLCAFTVNVTDINDNDPTFDAAEFKQQISEDLKEKSEVIRIFAYDIDEGDNSRLTYNFIPDSKNTLFNEYFRIDSATGVVYLNKSVAGLQNQLFTSLVEVHDNGLVNQRSATTEVSILVVSSDKQPPRIISYEKEIRLKENLSDFKLPLVNISAESNINDRSVVFELVKGKTTETNRDETFVLEANDTIAILKLGRHLDYETVTEYQLTVRVQNKYSLGASVNIIVKVEDVNDEIPAFVELLKGSVVENDVSGAQAMQVRAIDRDGTSPNNIVHYELLDHEDLFEINKDTGVITAIAIFDREAESLYHVNVKAYDSAPSALFTDSEPNSRSQKFQISIEDRNDNPPKFNEHIYTVHEIAEDDNLYKDVIEVKATDPDVASLIIYSIIEGNTDGAFAIEETTGRIKVNAKLDYEKIESYNLTVRAFDGIFEDTAKVLIYIINVNDERPIFKPYNKTIYFEEERLSEDGECIIKLEAYDPDIKDRNADQKIIYRVAEEHLQFLDVTKTNGCVKLIKKLDRDRPTGYPQYQGYIYAYDNEGATNSLDIHAEINIVLKDINDNAPFLNETVVVWYENENPGKIIDLKADDYDGPTNGPPFTFEISSDQADQEIFDKFSVSGKELYAKATFDREVQKYYDIPITIKDNGIPQQTGTSILRVIIGDRNDNEAKSGSSEIFVYKYEYLNTDIAIGRVYVDDPDDWDLPDKIFQPDGNLDGNFQLNATDKGMIVMNSNTPEGVYHLKFIVIEENLPNIERHEVNANVTVTVKSIPKVAVIKSGSIRMNGTTIEEFIEKKDVSLLSSKKYLLQKHLSEILNTSIDNVDVFTVLPGENGIIDVRFSAHGSPYYAPERLNNKVTEYQEILETNLGVEFVMISISECLSEDICRNSSCSNDLVIKSEPAVVFTNQTSFVGVKAIVEAVCDCMPPRIISECFNGGTRTDDGCICPDGTEGLHCEILGVGFSGDGWAMYPTFDACTKSVVSLALLPQTDNGLIFYVGPLTSKHAILSRDFMSLELRDGYVVLKLDLGNGPLEIKSNYKRVNDGALHKIHITFTTDDVQIRIDECSKSDCLTWKGFTENKKGRLNVNGPLQIGGLRNGFSTETSKILWQQYAPTNKGFVGCIRNFTYNSNVYNLGEPSDSVNAHINCNYGVAQAVTFGIDTNFLVAILVCIAILLILLLAVVVHRRKQDNLNEKDIDDTRENIINYEDEGGGECDTHFDLSVLRPTLDEKPPIKENLYKQGADVPADISGFLDNKRHTCDKDPDNLPYDDVRYYAYEGDGNSTGSLSSLASCTDEGDLKFNYLSSFGPRFRKLADMYGEDASDEDSQEGGEESWC